VDISRWVAHWAEWSPAKSAVRFEGVDLTYRDLEDRVGKLGAALRADGVAASDRVAFLGPSCPELLEVLFACGRLGAIFVPLNARMPPAELDVYLGQATPRAFVVEENLRQTAAACAPRSNQALVFRAGDGIATAPQIAPVRADPDADVTEPVLILFTSGTTSRPKGAVITNASVFANAADTVSALRMTADDEILTLTPMFHVAGLNLLTTPALSIGATVTIHREFSARSALEDIDAKAVTLLVASPPMTAQLEADPAWDRAEMASLRCVVTGGTTVTERSVRPWHQRNVRVVQSYGMTEAGPHVTLVPIDDVPARSLTAGRPLLRSQVRIVDPTGCDMERGRAGEIVVRGPAVMKEYWHNPQATREAFRDGWLRTGDVGFVDADGYLHVVDRLEEIIVVGTSNVYPADLESVLTDSPHIEAAAVVARADEQLGEVPVAFVVPKPGRSLDAAGVLALFDGRLANYKHPRDVLFLDALPRTSVGKPDKKALRAMVDRRVAELTRPSDCRSVTI